MSTNAALAETLTKSVGLMSKLFVLDQEAKLTLNLKQNQIKKRAQTLTYLRSPSSRQICGALTFLVLKPESLGKTNPVFSREK
jgi:hypothetical protein